MVTLNNLETEIREMVKFYAVLSENTKNDADKDYAVMASDSSKDILDLVEKYKSDPKNIYLKQLHSCLMTLVRGVEFFHDEDTQKEHEKYGPLFSKLFDYVDANVKW
jgi:hypothetical protein